MNRFKPVLFFLFLGFCLASARAGFHAAILGDRTGGADQDVFASVIDEIQQLHPDIVINVGDLIEGPQPDATAIHREWDTVLSTLDRLSMPFYCVAGNNDIFDDTSRDIYPERSGFQPYYSFDYQDVHVVILDNSQAHNVKQMGDAQLAWLEKDLDEHRKTRLTCIFFHKPFWYESFEKGESGELHDIFVRYGVDWVFSGHYHSYVSTERDGIQYVMVGSSGGHIGDNPARGEFYQYGWFTVTETGADFALLKSGAVRERAFLTLDTRIEQDRLEKQFLDFESLALRSGKKLSGTFTVSFSDLWEQSVDGVYRWDTEGTPWIITPGSGRYHVDGPGTSLSFRTSISGESVYPLPLLTVEVPMNGADNYPVKHKAKVSPEIKVKKRRKTPVIDGNFTDSAWSGAANILDFGSYDGGSRVGEAIEVLITQNASHLFFGIRASESELENMTVPESDRDGPIFRGDCVYLMFWNTSDSKDIYQVIINPDGVISDFKGTRPEDENQRPQMDPEWNGTFEVGSTRHAGAWHLEVGIPAADLGLTVPLKGQSIRLNIMRYQSRMDQFSSWVWPATFSEIDSGVLIFR